MGNREEGGRTDMLLNETSQEGEKKAKRRRRDGDKKTTGCAPTFSVGKKEKKRKEANYKKESLLKLKRSKSSSSCRSIEEKANS